MADFTLGGSGASSEASSFEIFWKCALPISPVLYPSVFKRSTNVTAFSESGMPFWRTPVALGVRPVRMVARFGMQIGAAT